VFVAVEEAEDIVAGLGYVEESGEEVLVLLCKEERGAERDGADIREREYKRSLQ